MSVAQQIEGAHGSDNGIWDGSDVAVEAVFGASRDGGGIGGIVGHRIGIARDGADAAGD